MGFGDNMIEIILNTETSAVGFEAGEYKYPLKWSSVYTGYYEITADGVTLSPILKLDTTSMVIDQRPADGFQYTFQR